MFVHNGGRGQLSSEWHHSENDVIMRTGAARPVGMSTSRECHNENDVTMTVAENKTVLPGGSRKLYISARKVIELWIEVRAVIGWVTPTTAFLMRQLIITSRLGRTEYQLPLMKILWWERNVKIRYKCFVVVDEFWTVHFINVFTYITVSLDSDENIK